MTVRFSQVSRTLPSILADVNHAKVWLRPLISNSSRAFPSLWEPSQAHQSHLVSQSPSYSTAFLVVWQSCLSFNFLWFSLSHSPERQNSQNDTSFLLLLLINTRSSLLARIIIIIIIIIIIYFWRVFNADGFPLESEWHQVSSSLQSSFQYSDRSQHSLHTSSYFQIL